MEGMGTAGLGEAGEAAGWCRGLLAAVGVVRRVMVVTRGREEERGRGCGRRRRGKAVGFRVGECLCTLVEIRRRSTEAETEDPRAEPPLDILFFRKI